MHRPTGASTSSLGVISTANSQYNSARYLKGMATFQKILLHSINCCPTFWLTATEFGIFGPTPRNAGVTHNNQDTYQNLNTIRTPENTT